jgi:hypothetical protein
VNLAGLQFVRFDADYDATCAEIIAALQPEPEDADVRGYLAEIASFNANRAELQKSRIAQLDKVLGGGMRADDKLLVMLMLLNGFVKQDVSAYQGFTDECRTAGARQWATATVRRLKALSAELSGPSCRIRKWNEYYEQWRELR